MYLFILCAIQTFVVGLYIVQVNYTQLGDYELLPAVSLHAVILAYIWAYEPRTPWHIVLACVAGLAVQSFWLAQQVKHGESLLHCDVLSECRHRTEYYVSTAYVAAVYTCALMMEARPGQWQVL